MDVGRFSLNQWKKQTSKRITVSHEIDSPEHATEMSEHVPRFWLLRLQFDISIVIFLDEALRAETSTENFGSLV